MDAEKRQELEAQRVQLNAQAKLMLERLKDAELDGKFEEVEKVGRALEVLKRKQKRVLRKLGLYKFSESETVEFEPGRFMSAEQYYWLLDE